MLGVMRIVLVTTIIGLFGMSYWALSKSSFKTHYKYLFIPMPAIEE
jgi:hypothetical protein